MQEHIFCLFLRPLRARSHANKGCILYQNYWNFYIMLQTKLQKTFSSWMRPSEDEKSTTSANRGKTIRWIRIRSQKNTFVWRVMNHPISHIFNIVSNIFFPYMAVSILFVVQDVSWAPKFSANHFWKIAIRGFLFCSYTQVDPPNPR